MVYSRRTSNYLEIKTLFDPIHMMSMTDLVAISVETPMKDSGCSLEKEFTKFIYMNPLIVLYVNLNQVNLCHSCVCGPLT